MIKSMTGYGRAEVSDDRYRVTMEIKSVNNRYLDLSIRMPRQLNQLEARIRKELGAYMKRGKVDVFISLEDLAKANVDVVYNAKIAGEYLAFLRQMAQEFGLPDDITASGLSRYPDVFSMKEETSDPELVWAVLVPALHEAAGQFLEARLREGAFLRQDLLAKLDQMDADVAFITERSPALIQSYRQKLTDKVRELLGDSALDEARIIQEVTIYADKVCVDEELVRLQSHIQAVRQALEGDNEGVGRRLDFIAQEMNRESNTILSKSDSLEVSDRAISLKTTVEKIREQIQNIE